METKEIIDIAISFLTFGATILLGYVGYKLTKTYSEKSDSINNDALFHNLFRDFNTRYGLINSYLKALEKYSENSEYSLKDLKENRELYDKMIDYLNICAEEYYWYRQDRLNNKVWDSWKFGMNVWYKSLPVLRALWQEEIAGEGYKSYYLDTNDNLFDEID